LRIEHSDEASSLSIPSSSDALDVVWRAIGGGGGAGDIGVRLEYGNPLVHSNFFFRTDRSTGLELSIKETATADDTAEVGITVRYPCRRNRIC
jgi:hypothetical protein